MRKQIIFSILLLAGISNVKAKESNNFVCYSVYHLNYIKLDTTVAYVYANFENDTLVVDEATRHKKLKKKIITAICAFPFPFGCVGMHRVLLGTKPWVPVVYVATLGGGFGILPLIDFCHIIFTKDLKKYEESPGMFMWSK